MVTHTVRTNYIIPESNDDYYLYNGLDFTIQCNWQLQHNEILFSSGELTIEAPQIYGTPSTRVNMVGQEAYHTGPFECSSSSQWTGSDFLRDRCVSFRFDPCLSCRSGNWSVTIASFNATTDQHSYTCVADIRHVDDATPGNVHIVMNTFQLQNGRHILSEYLKNFYVFLFPSFKTTAAKNRCLIN